MKTLVGCCFLNVNAILSSCITSFKGMKFCFHFLDAGVYSIAFKLHNSKSLMGGQKASLTSGIQNNLVR